MKLDIKSFKESEYKGYFVNADGDVINKNKTINTKFICTKYHDKDGYERIWVMCKPRRKFVPVHRLVAKAFIECENYSLVVNHIDGNKTNNNYSNLEWVTVKENEQHSRRVLGKRLLGEKASRSKLKEIDVINIRASNKTTKQLAEDYNISNSQILRIIKKKNWSHV